MQEPACYEKYPAMIVIGSNLLYILIYVISALILYRFGLFWVVCYVLFIIFLEFRLISGHCVNCYYYGKTCAFGKGKVCSLLFQRGRSEEFKLKLFTWKDVAPDLLAFIIPVLAGIVLLIQKFTWDVLLLVIALLLLGFVGNSLVRGNLACKYCRQREIGCPAEQLFDNKK